MARFFGDLSVDGLGGRVFVWLCIGIVALTVCLIALALTDVSNTNVVVFGITVFIALLLLQGHWEMRRDVRTLKTHTLQMADYESEVDRRIDYIASIVERDGGAAPDELAKRLRAINREIVQLSERMAALEAQPATTGPAPAGEAPSPPAPEPEPLPEPNPPSPPAPAELALSLRGSTGLPLPGDLAKPARGPMDSKRDHDRRAAATFRKAISGDRLAFHLVPILSLPDRQPAAYQAVMRLKGHPHEEEASDGEWTEWDDLLAAADSHGLRSLVERKTLYSAARMLRSVLGMGKRMRLFAPLSPDSLRDDRAFEEVALFLESNGSLRGDIVIELTQAAFRGLSGEARQRIGLVAEAGFALALCEVEDPGVDPATLRGLGFTHLRAPVATLADDGSDLVLRVASHRIECIATAVDTEADVARAIEGDVGLAQGAAMAPPRAVKAELLRTPAAGSARNAATAG